MLPPVQVRELLEASRRAGIDFPTAWQTAIAEVPDPKWRSALLETSAAWLAAYENRPCDRRDRAIDLLARGQNELLVDLTASPRCPICDGPVVPASPQGAAKRYCSHACQRAAHDRQAVGRLGQGVCVRRAVPADHAVPNRFPSRQGRWARSVVVVWRELPSGAVKPAGRVGVRTFDRAFDESVSRAFGTMTVLGRSSADPSAQRPADRS